MVIKFSHARALIDRAKNHIDEFKHHSHAFNNRNTPTIFVDSKSEPGVKLYKIAFTRPIPASLACITFDVVNELRSSLDHAVYRAVQIITDVDEPSNTKFPFGRTAEDASGRFKKETKAIPDSFKDFLLEFKPYEGGNHALWGLNKVRNEKIHRLLRGTAIGTNRFELGGTGYSGNLEILDEWDAANRELTVARQVGGHGLKLEFTHDIAFEETSPFQSQIVSEILDMLASEAEKVVFGIEAETARLTKITE